MVKGGRRKMNNSDHKKNSAKQHASQPEPMSGSKKVKNKNHSRAKNNTHHDM